MKYLLIVSLLLSGCSFRLNHPIQKHTVNVKDDFRSSIDRFILESRTMIALLNKVPEFNGQYPETIRYDCRKQIQEMREAFGLIRKPSVEEENLSIVYRECRSFLNNVNGTLDWLDNNKDGIPSRGIDLLRSAFALYEKMIDQIELIMIKTYKGKI